MKKDLLLICNQFPFSFGEAFLEIEFPYLYKSFRKIVIISRTEDDQKTREIPSDVSLIRKSPTSNLFEKLRILLYSILSLNTLMKLIKEEKKAYKYTFDRNPDKLIRKVMLHDAFKAIELKFFIKRNALPIIGNNAILYSYWQNSAALAVALLKKENPAYKSICRAHRTDLYLYAHKNNYLSFRKFLSENMDRIFFIADDGMSYQSKFLKKTYESYAISKLGTHSQEITNKRIDSDKILIVSCSTLTPVKRVHLIIEALAQIQHKNIQWIHFGDGILKDEIKLLAKKQLDNNENVRYTFKGNVTNTEIHRFYVDHKVDLFINVSESEGIPVSIMEAMSYGIPVIATDVGGTGELVDNDCGLLINKDINETKLVQIIETQLKLDTIKIKGINARAKWEENYSADKNFNEFIRILYV